MHILVTNDDGVQAPGILALAQALDSIGKVTILAPNRNWSASGHVKTLSRPLRIEEVMLIDGRFALASDGAPSDCVALAWLGVVQEPIDLVVSGINAGPNMGHDVTYSGTVTAAMEAVIAGIPGIAVSYGDFRPQYDYAPAAEMARRVVQRVVDHGLDKSLLLNVNVPAVPLAEMRGIRVTRQGMRVYRDELDVRHDPRGRAYYWIGGDEPTSVNEAGTDFTAIAERYVSITPLQLDLTAYETAQRLQNWFDTK